MTGTNNTPQDLAKLQKQLGEDNANANAVAEFVDGRISGLRNELSGIIAQQKANINAAKASGDPEVQRATNAATKEVKEANEAVKTAQSEPTPENAKQAKDKVEAAEKSVSKVESDLASRVSAVEGTLAKHKERLDALEGGQSGLGSSIEGLWTNVNAHAKAIAHGGGGGVVDMRRAGRVAIATFIVVAALWLLLVMITPITLGSWDKGLGLAAIAAGLAFAYQFAHLGDEDDVHPTEAEAEAHAQAHTHAQYLD